MNLEELLKKNRRYSPVFRGALANHTSMGLIALKQLGADSERLNEFMALSEGALDTLAETSLEITSANFERNKGKIQAFPAYLEFFRNLHAGGRSVDEVLRDYLPALIQGLAGGAFHPLIRLAYAIEQGDDDEIIYSVAFLSAVCGGLGELPKSDGATSDADDIFRKIRKQSDMRIQAGRGLIYAQMRKAAKLARFNSIIGEFHLDADCLPKIAEVAVRLYLAEENITTLHCVTGVHAFRVVMPYVQDVKTPLAALWQAICAAYIAVGAPEITSNKQRETSKWAEIKSRAMKSADVHAIKFVYSCHEEDKCYNTADYETAAMRQVSLNR